MRTGGAIGYCGIVDFEAAALDSYTIGKWKIQVNATSFTQEGTHPSQMGYNYIGTNTKVNLF